jgi:ferritin
MEAALVKQANQELQNSNVYLAMSLYFDRLLPPLEGFRNYFKKERYAKFLQMQIKGYWQQRQALRRP